MSFEILTFLKRAGDLAPESAGGLCCKLKPSLVAQHSTIETLSDLFVKQKKRHPQLLFRHTMYQEKDLKKNKFVRKFELKCYEVN